MNHEELDDLVSSAKADIQAIRGVNSTIKSAISFFISVALFFVISGMGVVVYWYLEPDPLTVSYIDDDKKWSLCEDRHYSFKRIVASDKDLTITIQERWHDINGFMDYKGTEGEYVYGNQVTYTLAAGFNKVMTFNKRVPNDIQVGLYEYRQWATYRVNPLKTITKLLPVQDVSVVCDYDPVKHAR